MELLTSVFRQLLSMSLTALPVMAVVLLLRFCLRKAPKKYSYALWLVVALRLACPILPESPVGLPQSEAVEEAVSAVMSGGMSQAAGWEGEPVPAVPAQTAPAPAVQEMPSAPAPSAAGGSGRRSVDWMRAAALMWLAGLAGMLAYIAVSDIRLRRRLATAVLREENIWECGGISTPFVLGLFRPRIYMPFRMTEEQRLYVLAHERHHIHRRDHWAKALALLLLAVYWWDPAVWLCWTLFCRDMEMSCDEAVLARLGGRARRDYSLSLVSFVLDRRAPMALAFGEHDASRRVKNVLKWKEARPAVTFLALAAVVLATVVCGTDAERGSWLEAKHTGSTVSFTCGMKEPIRSWILYQDIYENGKLVSSRPHVFDSFQDDGGALPREFSGSLTVKPIYAKEGGFDGSLDIYLQCVGGFAWECDILPKEHYTGMGSVLGDGVKTPGRWKLEDDGSVVLYTVLLSTEPNGGIRAGGTADDVFANDTVVRYRFVTSTLSLEELTADSGLARALFALRPKSAGERPDVEKMLEVLYTDALGTYTVSWREDGAAQVDFDSLSVGGGKLRLGMQKRAAAMMALCPELRVSWSYEDPDSGMETVESAGVLTREDWTLRPGTAALSEETAIEGIRGLLEGLDMYDLFTLLQGQEAPAAFWQLLNAGPWAGAPADPGLTDWSLRGGVLDLRFQNAPADPDAFDICLGKTAFVLMYVKPEEVAKVAWSYPGTDGGMVERLVDQAEKFVIAGLFADFEAATVCPVTSQSELDRLIRFADLDGRVYEAWMERSAGGTRSGGAA